MTVYKKYFYAGILSKEGIYIENSVQEMFYSHVSSSYFEWLNYIVLIINDLKVQNLQMFNWFDKW